MPGPAASTMRMIERRWPENVESDWAIDCSSPMSAKTSRQTGSRLPGSAGHVEAGLVHQAEEAERPQRDRLAAGVRAGHDQRGVAVAEPDVDRDDRAGQARMAGRQQDRLGPLGGLGPTGAHLARERRLGRPEVELRQRPERLAQGIGVGGHERGQLVEDARDLLGLGDLCLAPGVAQLDRDERLDEQRRAAPRGVVDDALDPRAGLGLDRHDVAAVAQRDDRLLEGVAQLRADERVEPAAQPVVGDADRRAQAPEARRGGVEQLPDRIEAPRQRRAQRRQRVQLAPEIAQERSSLIGEERGQAGGRVERRRDLQELAGFEAPATDRPLDGGADVVGGPDPETGLLLEERDGLVGLVEGTCDEDGVVRRFERLGQPA